MAEPTVAELADFQAALLEALSRHLSLEETRDHLRAAAVFAPWQRYLDKIDPRMLATAAELVKKWGRRRGAPADGRAAER